MLVSLEINNFALVDRLELDLDRGLNVLTGETGAGKSIILDAIDLALGGKVNSRMVRAGSDRTIVEATFQVNPSLAFWLQERNIEPIDSHVLVCTRELSLHNGRLRSRSRIDGISVNRQLMAELRLRLVEITAQGQTIDLLIPERQRELLDLYGGKALDKPKQAVAEAYLTWQEAKKKLDKRRKSERERLQKQDLLTFQLKELTEAELGNADELEQLEQERDRLSHIVELQQLSYQAYQILYQNDSEEAAAADLLAQAESCLLEMTEYDGGLAPILEMVQSGLAQIVEAGQQINDYGEALEADPERLGEIETRIRLLKQICRKYGPDLSDAIAFYDRLQQELAELTDEGQSLEALEQKYDETRESLQQACMLLTEQRKIAASKLETQLVKELKPLAMDKVVFECRLSDCEPTATGADKIIFYFSPNAGEAVQPLAVIASGGEMSRFLLALKACFSGSQTGASTLIFDEIDAGVSGKVAQAISEKLHQLSNSHQVLCVTHQPLVAAMADAHYKVEKTIIEEKSNTAKERNGDSHLPDIRTVVRVKTLTNNAMRTQELAQLTGGHSADDALVFAESLLNKAANYRRRKK
jgi:DNA repair protein RecN (Recombination protein N)